MREFLGLVAGLMAAGMLHLVLPGHLIVQAVLVAAGWFIGLALEARAASRGT